MKTKLPFFEAIFVYPAYLIFAIALLAAGITTLSCQVNGSQVDCSLKDTKMLGLVRTTTEIKGLRSARADVYDCGRIDSTDYNKRYKRCERLVLVSASSEFTPNLATSSVNQINGYLASGQANWKVQSSHWTFSAFAGGFAFLWYGFGRAARNNGSKPKPKKK